MQEYLIKIISLGWFANLLVKFWLDFFKATPNLRFIKPFSCQMCMGFWIGVIVSFPSFNLLNIITFASATSLSATLLFLLTDAISKRI